MNSNATAVILIILAIALFFTFTDSEYKRIKILKTEVESYKVASKRSDELLKKKNELIKAYKEISTDDKARLNKFLPDTIDVVRLIIEINDVLREYSVSSRNIQVSANTSEKSDSKSSKSDPAGSKYNYATINFSVSTSYERFIELLRTVENTLRVIDVVSMNLSVPEQGNYQYNVTMRTYWMK